MKEYNIKFCTIEFSTKPILFQKYERGFGGWVGGGGGGKRSESKISLTNGNEHMIKS